MDAPAPFNQPFAAPVAEIAFTLPTPGTHVLLINPHIYDTRLPWPRWQQPTLLLRLATYARTVQSEVRLIDLLHRKSDERLKRELAGAFAMGEMRVNRWRLGKPITVLTAQLEQWHSEGWDPDIVYVECFTTFWWRGAAEVIEVVRRFAPGSRIVLVGAYARLAPDHAREHTHATEIVTEDFPEITGLSADLSVYSQPPNFAYITLGTGRKNAADVAAEIVAKAARRQVLHFAFAEHDFLGSEEGAHHFREVLQRLIAANLRISLHVFGSIFPADLLRYPDLPALMREAGFKEISFGDHRDELVTDQLLTQLIEEHRDVAPICSAAGFELRTQKLNAAVCIGYPGENLEELSYFITLVQHHIGSVILWPYQPDPDDGLELPLEEQNSKLFPFRARNGYSYKDYLDFMGLAAILNAKYRDQSFDFLGDSLVSRLFRESMARQGWDPDPSVKGTLKLPVMVRP